VAALAFALLLIRPCAYAQPKNPNAPPPPLEPAEGERQAKALLGTLLAQKPTQNFTNTGTLSVREADRHEREVPVRFEILVTPTNWLNVYEAASSRNTPGERFSIIHADNQSEQYLVQQLNGKKLSPTQLMEPFASSDFWLVDLALEFLHWPQQRVLKKEMRKELFCDVLQSSNANPAPGGYSRVVSWVAVNQKQDIVIVHADAYDSSGKLLKEFNPRKVEKVNGVWQLEQMEIRNRQTGSRTRIEFNLDRE